MGFTWMVDPYNRFGRRNGGDRVMESGVNLVLVSMLEVVRLPTPAKRTAEVVIVGDSRVHGLTATRLASSEGRAVLNLGVGGASFEEMISFLNYEAPRLTSARLLIIGAPLERFAAAPRPDRCVEVQPVVANPLRYLANAEMLKNSWALWRKPAAKPDQAPREGRTAADIQRNEDDVRSTWRRMYADFDKERANGRVRALREAVKPFAVRGATVVFWSPPIRADISAQIDELDLQAERTLLSQEIASFGIIVDMTDWKTVAGHQVTFKDPVHANEASLILKELQKALPR